MLTALHGDKGSSLPQRLLSKSVTVHEE